MSENTTARPLQYPLPEGVYDNFTYQCKCGTTVTVGGSVARPHTCATTGASTDALAEVSAERERQNLKWGEQNHPNGTGDDLLLLRELPNSLPRYGMLARLAKNATDRHAAIGTVTFADILLEEVFEAMAENDPAKLRAELIQVAAVATQWVEAIDRAANIETIPDEHDEDICSGGVTMCHECYAAGSDDCDLA